MLLRFLLKNVRQPLLIYATPKYGKFSVIASDANVDSVRFLNGSCVRYSSRRSTEIDKGAEPSNDELNVAEIRALQVDSDSFGTLSSIAETPEPAPEKHDTISKQKDATLLQQHAAKIDALIEAKDISEAFNIFEEHVLKRDRLHPPISMFTQLLDWCIRYQMPENAFRIFSHMIERRLNVSLDAIDRLIESCELLEQSSKKMNAINRYLMRIKQKPNASSYNGMIRNYIRSGQWKEGFALVDQMKADGFGFEDETLAFILQGWSYDPDNGFRKVLESWHEIQRKSCTVNVETFNALLKCIEKCEIGDIDKLNVTIEMIKSKYEESNINEADYPTTTDDERNEPKNASEKYLGDGRPNLLHGPPLKGYLVPFESVNDPQKRLLILGGISGFMNIIKSNNIVPTLNTIKLFLDIIPNTIVAENAIVSLLKKHNLTPNIELYQQILTRMSIRRDYVGAKSVIEWMKDQKVELDAVTYGLWGISCKSVEHARQFLDEMRNVPKTSKPGVDLLNGMLTNATRFSNNDYVIEILRYMCEENVEPDGLTLKLINDYTKAEFGRLSKFRKPDKRTRNEFFKLSREHKQWVKYFNIDRDKLIDTQPPKSLKELRFNARISKGARNKSAQQNKPKWSGTQQKRM